MRNAGTWGPRERSLLTINERLKVGKRNALSEVLGLNLSLSLSLSLSLGIIGQGREGRRREQCHRPRQSAASSHRGSEPCRGSRNYAPSASATAHHLSRCTPSPFRVPRLPQTWARVLPILPARCIVRECDLLLECTSIESLFS